MTGSVTDGGQGRGAGPALARPRGAALRMLGLHRWLGRVVMLYFVLVFGTGTLMVFAPEIEALLSPQMQRQAGAGGATDFPALLETAIAAHPQAQPLILRAPYSGFLAASVEMRDGARSFILWADPVTGALQGETAVRGFYEIMRVFHTHLMLEKRPMLILVTLGGVVLLVQIVAGLRSAPRFWRNWGRLPPLATGAAPRTRWGGLHRWFGVWSLPVLLVACFTALIYLSEAVGFEAPLPAPRPAATAHDAGLPAGFDGASLSRAIEVARATLPGLDLREIYLPARAGEGIRLRGHLTATLVRPRANTVTVDPDDFTVLGRHRGEDLSLQRRLTELADPLHFGTFGGTPTRVLWAAMGMMATLLALSGLMIAAHRTSPVPPAPSLRAAIGAIWLPARAALGVLFLGVTALLFLTLFLQGS